MEFFFFVLAISLIIAAFGVVLFKNPIHSALCLVVNLLGVALLYAVLESHFLAAAQIIVYAGAIMVLLLFVIMLLNVKTERSRESRFAYVLAGSCAAAYLLAALGMQFGIQFGAEGFLSQDHLQIGQFASDTPKADVKGIGQFLFSRYLFAFEFASVLIMVAVVGAVVLAQTRRSNSALLQPRSGSEQ